MVKLLPHQWTYWIHRNPQHLSFVSL